MRDRIITVQLLCIAGEKGLLQQSTNHKNAHENHENKCRECGGLLRVKDHERVCMSCGLVNKTIQNPIHRVPFGQTYQPTSLMAFNKALGNTLRFKDLMRVLAQAPEKGRDLGMRARQIRVITELQEPQRLRKALELASIKLLKIFRKEDHILANEVAGLLRKLVAYLLVAGAQYRTGMLVDAVIYYVLTEKKNLEPNPPAIKSSTGCIRTRVLVLREKDLMLVRWFDESTRLFS
jgi:hypothetical protein